MADQLPRVEPFAESIGPLTRTDFVRFAGAGGDFNPNHHDEVHARAHGFPSVFAMGMFTASLASGSLTRRYGQAMLRTFKVRFIAPVWPGDILTVTSKVKDNTQVVPAGLQLTVTGQDGVVRMAVEAEIGSPNPSSKRVTSGTNPASPCTPFKAEDASNLAARVGDVVRTAILPIEGGKVKEFAVAMHEDSPVYTDMAAAKAAGYPGIPAPPVFTTTTSFHVAPQLASFPVILGLNRPRVVHGEQSWIYHRTPLVGDVLSCVSRLASVDVRKNSKGEVLRFIRIDTEFVDEHRSPVVEESMLAIEKM